MKITFLGTSHGVPAEDRYCQSMLIETQNGGYIIDAGAPVMDCLLRIGYDLKKLKAVFITHMHSDHVYYLFSLLTLASWYYKEMDFDVYVPEQAAIDGITHFLGVVSSSFPNDRVRLRLIEGCDVYQDEELKVTAFPTEHMGASKRPAYGYLLEAEGKKLYISGDLNGQKIDYQEFVNEEGVDTFVVECAHFPAEKLIDKLRDCKAKRVMPVHVFPVEKYDVLREAEKELPFEMEYPNDGDCFEI
ncbi:MAG: ribonuclease Z [Lachnospiraceae bacterium]|nr:ribonuclease Z [Lachnospiraceae bacterium]